MEYDIISTGSKGNAVVINKQILIDCGVSYSALKKYERSLLMVLLTHKHGDHFKKSTIKQLARMRPSLRFVCGKHLVPLLLECGVKGINIDVVESGLWYKYLFVTIEAVDLVHDVPNIGYKLYLKDGKRIFYATDTANLNGIEARYFDLYMVEANYVTDEINERISAKKERMEYAYEHRAKKYHLSKELADDFIYRNIGANGTYVYLHNHIPRKDESYE